MIARICFLFLFSMQIVSGQKIVQKTILNNTDTAIDVNTTDCYLVTIHTSKTNEIVVEATMAGATAGFGFSKQYQDYTGYGDVTRQPGYSNGMSSFGGGGR